MYLIARARIVFRKTLRRKLENKNFLKLIIFLIDEHSKFSVENYTCFAKDNPSDSLFFSQRSIFNDLNNFINRVDDFINTHIFFVDCRIILKQCLLDEFVKFVPVFASDKNNRHFWYFSGLDESYKFEQFV